jgi:AbrB family looped-hinge helix DNA binding protein
VSTSVKLSSKGQVTIPKVIREFLGLEPGDRLLFRVKGGDVVVEAVGNLMDWYGAAHENVSSANWRAVRDRVRLEIGLETAGEGTGGAGEAEDDAGR